MKTIGEVPSLHPTWTKLAVVTNIFSRADGGQRVLGLAQINGEGQWVDSMDVHVDHVPELLAAILAAYLQLVDGTA